MKENIQGIRLRQLPNGAHYTFVKRTLELAQQDEALMARCGAVVSQLEAALQNEVRFVGLSRKSMITDDLEAADRERDILYSAYKAVIRSYAKVGRGATRQAAKALMLQMEHYRVDVREGRTSETGRLVWLLSSLERESAPHVQTLGIAQLVGDLRRANMRYDQLLEQRHEERMHRPQGNAQGARRASDAIYRRLIKTVNAYLTLEGGEVLSDFAKHMNVTLKHYKQRVLSSFKSSCGEHPAQGEGPTSGE